MSNDRADKDPGWDWVAVALLFIIWSMVLVAIFDNP